MAKRSVTMRPALQKQETRKPNRNGPTPAGLHLATAAMSWSGSLVGLTPSKRGWMPWNRAVAAEAESLRPALAAADPDRLAAAVADEAARRFDALIAGVAAYRAHPHHRQVPDVPVAWSQGASRLLDFSALATGEGPAVLIVPSLVNRWWVLDLSAPRSFVRRLASHGVRCFVMDWGMPGPAEAGFDLADYVAGRLEDALEAVRVRANGPVAVAGYCMGGLLALALALRRPQDVNSLALLATPFDFHAGSAQGARMAAGLLHTMAPVLAREGILPSDAIQALFWALDPLLVARKFVAFSRLDASDPAAAAFVELEDWLNDGVPLTAGVARQCFGGWYGDNAPARGQWRLAGRVVDPAQLRRPCLVLVPQRDRIVPPDSALALAKAITGAHCEVLDAGHIGMVAGRRTGQQVADRLARWFIETAVT